MNGTAEPIRVLHLDDDPDLAALTGEVLEREDGRFEVVSATRSREAIQRLDRSAFDCIVSDYDMPDSNGIEFLEAVRERGSTVPFILYTGHGSEEIASEAISAGVTDYVRKESGTDHYTLLANRIQRAVEYTRSQRALEERNRRLETLIDSLPGIVYRTQNLSEWPMESVDGECQELCGYSISDLESGAVSWGDDVIHPEDRQRVWREVQQGVPSDDGDTADDTFELTYRIVTADDETVWVWERGQAVVDSDGSLAAIEGFITDITHRKAQQHEREATVAFLQDIHDVTTDTSLTFDEKIEYLLSLGCEELSIPYGFLTRIDIDSEAEPDLATAIDPSDETNAPEVDIIRDGFSGAEGLVRPDDVDAGSGMNTAETSTFDDSIGTQTIISATGSHELLQPGVRCPLSAAYCRKTIEQPDLLAIENAVESGFENDPAYEVFELGSYIGGTVTVDDHLYGTLCFASADPRVEPFSDADRTFVRLITKWVSYELERQYTTAKLQAQNERLEEFASIVSHDLRNPLNVATGRVELAREDRESDHLEHATHALERMETMIHDLLTLAREGASASEIGSVHLDRFGRECWRNVETGSATLQIETDRVIHADRSRLHQLFENLFRNAIEHGSAGSPARSGETVVEDGGSDVTVTIGALEDGFVIEDDGPGIHPEHRDQVFELGYSTTSSGTGVGLNIVDQIVESHGWEVSVTNGGDGGARFEITGVARGDRE